MLTEKKSVTGQSRGQRRERVETRKKQEESGPRKCFEVLRSRQRISCSHRKPGLEDCLSRRRLVSEYFGFYKRRREEVTMRRQIIREGKQRVF